MRLIFSAVDRVDDSSYCEWSLRCSEERVVLLPLSIRICKQCSWRIWKFPRYPAGGREKLNESLVLVSGRTCQITMLSSEQPDNEGSVMGRTTQDQDFLVILLAFYLNGTSIQNWDGLVIVFHQRFFFLFNLFTVNKSRFAAVYYCMCVCACDVWVNIYSPICPIDLFLCRFPILINSMLLFYYSECFAFQVCLSPTFGLLLSGIVQHSWYWHSSLKVWRTYCMFRAWHPASCGSVQRNKTKRLLLRSVWPEGKSLLWHTVECAQFSKRDWAKMN